MRLAILLLTAALAAACGNPDKRLDCSGTSGCPAGFYCATEGVCWPDSTPPVVGTATASCVAPCARDGAVHVAVTASDAARMGTVRVRLDLDPSRTVTLPKTAAGWEGDVPLAPYPFPGFEQAVAVTVEAVDEAGNVKAKVVDGTVAVTRLKWVYEGVRTDVGVAVYPDGSVLVASEGAERLLRVGIGGAKRWGAFTGTEVFGTPSIGNGVAWIGSASGAVLAIGDDGAVLNGSGCVTGGSPLAAPAVTDAGDIAFVPSQVGNLFAVDGALLCRSSGAFDAFKAPVVVHRDATLVTATSLATAQLQSFAYGSAGFRANWGGSPPPPEIGLELLVGPAIDGFARTWTATTDGKLNATTSAGATSTVKQVGANPTGPVILADGSVVLGDSSGTLQRYRPDGTSPWATPLVLGATPQTPLVLTDGDATLIVPTAGGKLFALRFDGTEVWSTQLAPLGGSLRPGNIFTPAGSPVSLGYFPASNGKLYAVVLDGRLDASAPWPKAFHDPRNTGNAATPIP